jgi:hypothetical protein
MKIMIPALLMAGILFTGFTPAAAQKAFEMAIYTGKLQSQRTTLLLGSGYLGASEVRIYTSKTEWDTFYPEAGVPDEKAKLSFRTAGKSDKRSFLLSGISEEMGVPKTISAKYYDGKRWLPVTFSLARPLAVQAH